MDASSFARIPRELRDMIFDLALDCPLGLPLKPIPNKSVSSPEQELSLSPDWPQTSFPSLVLVCKQFHEEVTEAAGDIHHFRLPTIGIILKKELKRLPTAVAGWLESMSVEERRKIRSLTLPVAEFRWGCQEWDPRLLAYNSNMIRSIKYRDMRDVEHSFWPQGLPLVVAIQIRTRGYPTRNITETNLLLKLPVGDKENMETALKGIKDEAITVTSTMSSHDRIWNQMQLKRLWPIIEKCTNEFA